MIKDWDKHWTNNMDDPIANIKTPSIWSDFVWKFSLNFSRFKEPNKINFLELGAGSSSVTRYVHKNFNFNCTVLDRSSQALKLSELIFKRDKIDIKTINSEIKIMPFKDNEFDIIFLGGVMEYLNDIESCVIEINRILKPGGKLIFLTVPNVFNIQFIGNIFFKIKKFFYDDCPSQLVPKNAKKWYSKRYENILLNSGFINVYSTYINPFPQIPLPEFLKKIYSIILTKSEKFINSFNRKNFLFKRFICISFICISTKDK
jgi:ubiquinone/menaquinone biosynthesis C-methylase UbiE